MAPQLRIERIECVPLSMPLPRTFRGSNYFMTHRCTIITRVYTSAGIVGEIYNGDEFETQGEVVKIILDEIQPLLIGKDAFNIEGCWELMRKPSTNILRDRKLAMCAQACVDSALWDAVGKALDAPLYKVWGGYADRLPSICIAGYYEEGKTLADFGREMEQIKLQGHAGCKFKVGGRTPAEDAERVRVARKAVGESFVLVVDANQAWTLRQAVEFSRSRGRSRHSLVRRAGALGERPPRHGGGAQPDGHSDLRRTERDLPLRLPRSDDVGRDRRVQLRRQLGRRADRVATRGRAGGLVRRRDGTSRGTADFRPPAGRDSERDLPRDPFIRIAIRCSIASSPIDRRSRTDFTTCHRGQVSDWSSTRTRSGNIAYNQTNENIEGAKRDDRAGAAARWEREQQASRGSERRGSDRPLPDHDADPGVRRTGPTLLPRGPGSRDDPSVQRTGGRLSRRRQGAPRRRLRQLYLSWTRPVSGARHGSRSRFR